MLSSYFYMKEAFCCEFVVMFYWMAASSVAIGAHLCVVQVLRPPSDATLWHASCRLHRLLGHLLRWLYHSIASSHAKLATRGFQYRK